MKKFVSLFLVLLMCGSIFLSSACSADSAAGASGRTGSGSSAKDIEIETAAATALTAK